MKGLCERGSVSRTAGWFAGEAGFCPCTRLSAEEKALPAALMLGARENCVLLFSGRRERTASYSRDLTTRCILKSARTQNSRFSDGNLVVLNLNGIDFFFQIDYICYICFTNSCARPRSISVGYSQICLYWNAFALDENVCFPALRSLKNMFLVLSAEVSIS